MQLNSKNYLSDETYNLDVQEKSHELAWHQSGRHIWGVVAAAAGQNGNGNLHRKVVYVVVDLALSIEG